MAKKQKTLEELQAERDKLNAEIAAIEQASAAAKAEEAKKAYVEIDQLTKQARELISQAERIADKHQIQFYFSVEYGMGGSYRPEEGGWVSSSQDC